MLFLMEVYQIFRFVHACHPAEHPAKTVVIARLYQEMLAICNEFQEMRRSNEYEGRPKSSLKIWHAESLILTFRARLLPILALGAALLSQGAPARGLGEPDVFAPPRIHQVTGMHSRIPGGLRGGGNHPAGSHFSLERQQIVREQIEFNREQMQIVDLFHHPQTRGSTCLPSQFSLRDTGPNSPPAISSDAGG